MNRANNELMETLFAMLGGVGATLATTALTSIGISLPVAAGGVAIAAGLTAASARGPLQAAAMGAIAGSTARLVAHWYAAIDRRLRKTAPPPIEEPTPEPVPSPAPRPPRLRRAKQPAKPNTPPPEPTPKPDDGPLIIKEPIAGFRLSPDLEAP